MPETDTDKLEKYASIIYGRMEEFNNCTLKIIAGRIKATGRLSAYDSQTLKNIADITGDMEAITKKLADITKMNIADIEDIYTMVMEDSVNTYKPLYDFKNMPFVPFAKNEYAKQLVKSQVIDTAGKLIRLSRIKTLGFDKYDASLNVVGHTPLKEAFEQAVSGAIAAARCGTADFNSAVKKITEDFGGSGVKVIYGSGVNRSLSAVVRQSILYGAKQSAHSYDEYIGQKLGCNGFEVDAHVGCRPSHLFMQGKMYSYNGRVTVNGITYEDGADALKALGDYGCMHIKSDVILGVSVPRYSKEEIMRINRQSTELIEFNGKKKTLYEWKQVQRRLENAVRREQSKRLIAKASGQNELSKQYDEKIRTYRTAYDKLCSTVGLLNRTDKMAVFKGKRIDTKSGAVYNASRAGLHSVISGHNGAPRKSVPNSVIDHVQRDGKVDKRVFYGANGMMKKEIHTTNHGNSKWHSYGEHGEHSHDCYWNENGKMNYRTTRELTEAERKENGDIL